MQEGNSVQGIKFMQEQQLQLGRMLDIAEIVWVIGIAGLLLYNAMTSFSLQQWIQNKISMSKKEIEKEVYEIQGIDMPFVFGMIRPKVYLPIGLRSEERAYILEHEKMHIKRGDYIIKPIAFAILCIHWLLERGM